MCVSTSVNMNEYIYIYIWYNYVTELLNEKNEWYNKSKVKEKMRRRSNDKYKSIIIIIIKA